MKLRHMSASVSIASRVSVRIASTGEVVDLENAAVLTSYSSIVAAFGNGTVYLLPRHDYSVTTWKHVHAFVQDHTTVQDTSAAEMRKVAKTIDSAYQMADMYSLDGRRWNAY